MPEKKVTSWTERVRKWPERHPSQYSLWTYYSMHRDKVVHTPDTEFAVGIAEDNAALIAKSLLLLSHQSGSSGDVAWRKFYLDLYAQEKAKEEEDYARNTAAQGL